ncbi:galactose-1-phosphate uridylyltransferase [Yinghuangia sp. ASG 101]|uniref:galactose-1-phosphate uridylyltransferase n=1 Tax=Yinghuangia sp. ASG 101 TaxID=2896848 RepID=UPI001E3D8B90|nr:galactose-1-phosphate uridylyltransferase [Yinghuangia sp. ASG 101]UGQ10849.1 galactose-1-phosphate uridylyltransferase [Yinghuangia sp. ASG 101]
MQRVTTRLADGRELLYYFDGPVPGDGVPADRRDLAPHRPVSELRYDALRDEWVVVATHRQGRTHLPGDDACPLCPSTADRLSEIPARGYDVAVFENRFPSLAAAAGRASRTPGRTPDTPGLFAVRGGSGRCEVVCFTSDHEASFADLPAKRVRTVVDAWCDRTTALSELPDVEQVFPFENRGEEIGVTLAHPHGQIFGYPFVTPRTRRMLANVRDHRERTGRNLHEDRLNAELAHGVRLVARTERWAAFVPAAARWPFEVHLYPLRHVPDLPALDGAERDDLAVVYPEILRGLDRVFGVRMPYIAAWHQAPVRRDRESAWLHLELFSTRRAPGKLKYPAGSESGMDVFINDIAPEHAAALLRGDEEAA